MIISPTTTLGYHDDSSMISNDVKSLNLRFLSRKGPLKSHLDQFLPWLGFLVWPLMLSLPLLLTSSERLHYSTLFPRHWYSLDGERWLANSEGIWNPSWLSLFGRNLPLRHPLGLILGISAVVVGHSFVVLYFRMHHQQYLGRTTYIQSRGGPAYVYSEAFKHHLSQPGGFFILVLYLTFTWVADLLPPSYFSFSGGIQYTSLVLCLIVQDFFQFVLHHLEHGTHPKLYRISHKPHHRFTNPKLFDAFDGSVMDTILMILLPLFLTAHVVRSCNVWTYMAFGSIYANWLTLIHSELTFPWETMFRKVGLGTAADHHVHHKFFKYNFGHLFMWFDRIGGTYRNPKEFWGKEFNCGV